MVNSTTGIPERCSGSINPNLEVTLQFKEDTIEQRNNEHLKHCNKLGMDERDMYYNQHESR